MFTTTVAAARIVRELPQLERTVDQAIADCAALIHSMALARQIESVSAGTGQAAFLRLSKAQQNLIDAASEVHRVHAELSKINREIHGGPTHNEECPWPDNMTAEAA